MKTTFETRKVLALLTALVVLFSVGKISTKVNAEETVVEDTVFWQTDFTGTAGSTISPSSGSPDRWNTLYAGVSQIQDDPAGGTNTAGYFLVDGTAAAKSFTIAKSYLNLQDEALLSTRIYLPGAIAGSQQPFTINFGGKQVIKFTYDSTLLVYTYTVGANTAPSGRVNLNQWVKLNMILHPGSGDTPAAWWSNTALRVVVSGSVADAVGAAQSQIATDTTLNLPYTAPVINASTGVITSGWGSGATPKFEAKMSVPMGSSSGFYLDDVRFCQTGSLAVEDVAIEEYPDDPFCNPKADGKITLKINHDVDPALFSQTQVHVKKADGTPAAAPNVIFDASRPNVLLLDFAQCPLDYHTDYVIELDETLADITGRTIGGNYKLPFSTKGIANESSAAQQPVGGYRMPDEFNTGHVSDFSSLVELSDKYPELGASGKRILTEAIARKYGRVFEGFKLDDGYIEVNADSVILRDFYIDGNTYYAIQNKANNLTVLDGEITGTTATTITGGSMTLRRLYLHDVGADHLKPGSNWLVESCYLKFGGNASYLSHADGMQISGNTTTLTSNIRILGNRIDVVPLPLKNMANAALFCSLDFGPAANINMSYNWVNGGGFTTYISSGGFSMTGIIFAHNKFGPGNRYGHLTGDMASGSGVEDNTALDVSDQPCVGSVVYKDASGKQIKKIEDAGTSVSCMVNFVNYTLREQAVSIVAKLMNPDGQIVQTVPVSTSIPRYIPTSEYLVPENLTVKMLPDESGVLKAYSDLINYPDQPLSVQKEVSLTGLPQVKTGYSILVTVYDGDPDGTLLRTDTLGTPALVPTIAYGDINADGIVDISDVISASEIAVGNTNYTEEQVLLANVSSKIEALVDVSDVILIAERAVGDSDPFPVEVE